MLINVTMNYLSVNMCFVQEEFVIRFSKVMKETFSLRFVFSPGKLDEKNVVSSVGKNN